MKKFWLIWCLLCLGLAIPLASAGAAPNINYIDPAALKSMMGDPNLVIIDTSKGWWTYKEKIPGSLVEPGETKTWAANLSKDKKIVLYCG